MKIDEKGRFAALLHDLARQVATMDDDKFEKLLSGESRLEVHVAGESHKEKREKRKRTSMEDLQRLHNSLRNTETREQARELIDGCLYTKEDLFQFARLLDVPFPKTATIDNLKVRLVEATVGFRIRSAAVQGHLDSSKRLPERVE